MTSKELHRLEKWVLHCGDMLQEARDFRREHPTAAAEDAVERAEERFAEATAEYEAALLDDAD